MTATAYVFTRRSHQFGLVRRRGNANYRTVSM
jgi:hypothetical protein